MNEPVWLRSDAVTALHAALIDEHGGVSALRDAGLLESALARPVNRYAYEPDSTIPELAAGYAYGLALNHPFVDGNKRISLVASAVFLDINAYSFDAERMDVLRTFLQLAAGELAEGNLATWFENNSAPMDI